MSVELIANAIIAAATSGAITAASDTTKKAIADAYSGLKSLITRKFGGDSPAVKAVNEVEKDPASKGYQIVLAEKLESSRAAADPEIVSSAQALLELLKAIPQSGRFSQVSYGAGSALSGHHGTSTTTNYFETAPPRDRHE